jgi:hypothetical protein
MMCQQRTISGVHMFVHITMLAHADQNITLQAKSGLGKKQKTAQTCADRLGEKKTLRYCHWSSIDVEVGNSSWYVLKPFACNLSYVIQISSWISSHRAEVSQFDKI